ncbi:MAG TPA: hypothetical protein VMS23_03785 [Terrimicrobiaceae bacterium]|nr:hypothetical protein [Terrimicrobiaceae bacterium]
MSAISFRVALAGRLYQASMGIYVFKREVLKECLDNAQIIDGRSLLG